jgi:hypothetical protein
VRTPRLWGAQRPNPSLMQRRMLGRIRRKWGRDRRLVAAPGRTRQSRSRHRDRSRQTRVRSRIPGDRCRDGRMNSRPRDRLRNRMDTGLEARSPPRPQRHADARSSPSRRGLHNPRASPRWLPDVACGQPFRRSHRYMERRPRSDRPRKATPIELASPNSVPNRPCPIKATRIAHRSRQNQPNLFRGSANDALEALPAIAKPTPPRFETTSPRYKPGSTSRTRVEAAAGSNADY